MKKISKENFKNLFKKITAIFFLLIILSPISFSFAADPSSANTGAPDISKINADGKGLVPPCAHQDGPPCTLQDLFGMIKPIRDLLIYAVMIVVVGYTIYAGVGLVFYGDVPEYRQKLKKIFKNGVIAIVILVVAVSIIFAALVSFGFNQNILDVLKQIFTFNDFSFVSHALAQSSTTASTSNQYVDLFPQQNFITILQKTVKFIINYIVAPILVMGVIWAGFRFVKAEGNPEELASAKKFGTWVLIAIAIAVAAPLLLNMVLSTIQSIIS
ncbi:MAG: hypothetical protein QG630_350 [Patescibacteria group bacterium]|nr:hypothetical protein [Patescibacteria group bacterium]